MPLCIFTNDLLVITKSFVEKLACSLFLNGAPPWNIAQILEQEFDLECVNIARPAPYTLRREFCCRFIQMKNDMLYRCWISMLFPPVHNGDSLGAELRKLWRLVCFEYLDPKWYAFLRKYFQHVIILLGTICTYYIPQQKQVAKVTFWRPCKRHHFFVS